MPTTVSTKSIADVRKDFPIIHTEMNGKPMVFLDSAASSQKPQVVIDAISNYYQEDNANVHRGVYALSQRATDAFEHARAIVQRFINAPSLEEVIFVRGVTEGINLVASSFGRAFVKPGDEVIISTMEHHSNIVPWQLMCEHHGASLKVVPINDKGELLMDDYKAMLNDRVKIVAISHISNALGTINPIEDIIKEAHAHGIPVLVDGAQAAPHGKVDVKAIDADFYVFSGHKVYGPTGIGILYGKREYLDAMPPYHGGGEMIETVTFEKTTYNVLPHKFEAGTPDISGVIALGVALEYMESVGLDELADHEQRLLKECTDMLTAIPEVRIVGTADHKTSVISFLVEGAHPYDVGVLLDKQGIAVRTGHHCCQPLMQRFGIPGTVRASFGMYNDSSDIEALRKALMRAIPMLT